MGEMKKKASNPFNAGSAGPSGSHQSHTVKEYLPKKPIKVKSGNTSQSTNG